MRSLAIVLGGAVLLAACGGTAAPSASPTVAATTAAPTVAATPAPTPTQATSLKFTADLKPANEVPPVTNEEKSGSGKVSITIDVTRDATGKITGGKASADISVSGLPATAAIILAHIHGPNAPAGTNANPVIGFKTDAANAVTVTNGGWTFKMEGVTADAAVIQQIVDDPSKFYFNVHSKANPGGVTRGQLAKG